jgi:protein phosphatase
MFQAFGATDKGCIRSNNEDCFVSAPELGLFAVADGMGGAAAGERASRIAIETLKEIVAEEGSFGGMNLGKLTTAFHEVNRRIKATATEDSRLEGMGTTMVAAVEFDGQLLVASVGDSRAYRFEHGALTPITDDQTWVNEIGRKLGLPEDVLKTHPMRHVLTMALGVSPQLKINHYDVDVDGDALLLLSSDGLHGVVNDAEITEILASGGTLEQQAQRLITAARAHGGPDNITVVLIQR